jgi:hypothetical protein
VILNYNLFIEMKKYNSYEIDILKLVRPGTTVKNAYEIYIEESNFNAMETPFGLPRHSYDAICPSNIVLVLIELITRQRKNDRGIYYSFEGYALYLLVDILNESIWDARGEITDP